MKFDLLQRRADKFVVWIPGRSFGASPPQLVIGILDTNATASFVQKFKGPFVTTTLPDLWEFDPSTLSPSLDDGVYYYWFEVQNDSTNDSGVMLITDPIAYSISYKLVQQPGNQPAAVIKYRDNKLWPCDIDGTEAIAPPIPALDSVPDNNHLVIYELPVSWAKPKDVGGVETDVGTFLDVLALFDIDEAGDRFKDIPVIANQAILSELGINGLELLPTSDAKFTDGWGYAPANYFATDYDLGSSAQLVKLVSKIHKQNTRLFTDIVMAFGYDPYVYMDYQQFHIRPTEEPKNPDSYQSHATGELRNGWGGESWRYLESTYTYDPESGTTKTLCPSWVFHRAHQNRWMSDFGVGGYRLDSVNNIGNWDFVRQFKDAAWALFNARYPDEDPQKRAGKFLVIGEELSMPVEMVTSGVLNSLWNEPWQGRLRAILLGESTDGDDFEWTVRKMANCTLDSNVPFTDGAQAINYITSHDVEGYRKERLYNFLNNNGVTDIERRAKLAFACFLTAVGIPMIFAGEEFCDQMDRPIASKQDDPVNYARKEEDWRSRVFSYVANLIRFRKECPALGDDDTNFIHVDDSREGKIMAWTRGGVGQAPVVVVANFSDDDTPGAEYDIPNWPEQNRNDWREVTQDRAVPRNWVGREPLMHWEVKIYTYWKS